MHDTSRVVAALPIAAPADSPAPPQQRKRSKRPFALAPAVAKRTAEWGPPKPLTPAQREAWETSAGIVREWVAKSAPPTPSAASVNLWATARLAIWAVVDLGTLDASIVLTDQNIQYFVAHVHGDRPAGWRHAIRTALCRVGRAVNPAGFAPPLPVVGRAEVPPVYTPSEEFGFALDVAMPGRGNDVARKATVLLALGAGRQGPAIAAAGPRDLVACDGGRFAIRVDDQLIPIRAPYTKLARRIKGSAGDTFVTAKNRSAVSTIARRIKDSNGDGLSLRRARVTWIAAHLVVATPLAALRKLAGPLGGPTLTALLDYTSSELDPEEALEMGWGA